MLGPLSPIKYASTEQLTPYFFSITAWTKNDIKLVTADNADIIIVDVLSEEFILDTHF